MPDVVLPNAIMPEAPPALPGAGGGTAAGISLGAYISNPTVGKDKLTAAEAMDAISRFSSVLAVTMDYRAGDGRVFNGR